MRQELADYCHLNMTKMLELSPVMDGSEIKMLFAIMYCLNESDNNWFVNNAETREKIAQMGFAKTPERFSAILGSMVKKGILNRVTNGVYSLPENLYIVP